MNNVTSKRVSYTINNAVWFSIFSFSTIIFGFIVRTFLIKYLGSKYLGMNSFFNSIVSTLSLAEMGFDTAMLFYMYKPFSENNFEVISELLYLYKKVYRFIGLFILVISLLILPFISCFLQEDMPSGINIYYIYLIYVINTISPYFLYPHYRCLFSVSQKVSKMLVIISISNISMYTIQLCILYYLKSYFFFVLVLMLFTILQNIFISIKARNEFEIYLNNNNRKRKIHFPDNFAKHLWGVFASKIRLTSRSYIDTIIITYFLGLVICGKYSIYITFLSLFDTLMSVIILPAVKNSIGDYIAQSDINASRKLFTQYCFITHSLLVCFTCIIISCTSNFITIWVGDEMLLNTFSTVFFAFLYYVKMSSTILETIKDVTGINWKNWIIPFLEMIINLILDLLLLKYFSYNGILIATILSILIITLPSDYFLICKYFRIFNCLTIIKFLLNVILEIGIVLVIYFLNLYINGDNIISLIMRVLFSTSMSLFLYLLIHINSKELKDITKLIKSFFYTRTIYGNKQKN